eukprot:CAMPEP_0117437910 /NCGR_PEP_ID=MMETSP0759-20121206/1775_1 /TAXON_ID=63605 /ORGANISM="Percolomonas cosmopolitus, Strain WS" /LENGTH=702 /DNA_ID=CAMNT_0005229573 /DNA_START=237 /DNA_END=2341 /DNA_ORIENTATION=-
MPPRGDASQAQQSLQTHEGIQNEQVAIDGSPKSIATTQSSEYVSQMPPETTSPSRGLAVSTFVSIDRASVHSPPAIASQRESLPPTAISTERKTVKKSAALPSEDELITLDDSDTESDVEDVTPPDEVFTAEDLGIEKQSVKLLPPNDAGVEFPKSPTGESSPGRNEEHPSSTDVLPPPPASPQDSTTTKRTERKPRKFTRKLASRKSPKEAETVISKQKITTIERKKTKVASRKRKRTDETSNGNKKTKRLDPANPSTNNSINVRDTLDVDTTSADEGTKDDPMIINSDDEIEAPKSLRRFIYDSWNGKVMSAQASEKLKRVRDRGAESLSSRRQEGNIHAYKQDWRYEITDSEARHREGTETEQEQQDEDTFSDLFDDDPAGRMEEEDDWATEHPPTGEQQPTLQPRGDDEEDDDLIIGTTSARTHVTPRTEQPEEKFDEFLNGEDDMLDENDDFLSNLEAGGRMGRDLDDQDNYEGYTRTEETFGDRTYVNQITFARRAPTKRWSKEEVQQLFEALQMFGTDFALISRFFPTRNRREIKNKFSSEEKKDPENINFLLNNKKSIDLERFMAASKAKDERLGIVRHPYVEDEYDLEAVDETDQQGEEEDEWARIDESMHPVNKSAIPSSESDDETEAPTRDDLSRLPAMSATSSATEVTSVTQNPLSEATKAGGGDEWDDLDKALDGDDDLASLQDDEAEA